MVKRTHTHTSCFIVLCFSGDDCKKMIEGARDYVLRIDLIWSNAHMKYVSCVDFVVNRQIIRTNKMNIW